MRTAPPVELSPEQRTVLERLARQRSLPARVVERARIVLRAAEGLENRQIAQQMGMTPEKAARWRKRFLEGGIAALEKDAPRPGRARSITDRSVRKVVEMTLHRKPANATHWSTRTMAAAAGISEASVRRIWRAHGLKPHLVRTFKLSRDPEFTEKLEDIVGRYLNPPEHAMVLCADEKSQIQALDRTQPGLPMKKGRSGTMTHDYKRNGTATLFAALDALQGQVISMCEDRHRHQEWLKFLRAIDYVVPASRQIHMIVDNYALAQPPSPLPHALHPHQLLMAEYGGALLPRPDPKSAAPRRLPQRRGADYRNRRVHRPPQRKPQAVHLDRQSRRHPGEGQTCPRRPP
jgi:transposase